MTAILLACFAGLCLGAVSVGTRLALRRAPSILAGAFVMNTVAFCVVSVIALITGVTAADLELDTLWPFLVIGAVVPGTTQMLYIQAVRDAGAARTQLILATAPLVAALLAVGFLSEEWGALLIVGTLLIVGGGMALAWDPRRPAGFRALGIGVAVSIAIITGGRDAATRWALSETDASVLTEAAATLFASAVMTVLWSAVIVRRRPDLPALRAAAVPFGLVALLMGASYAAIFGAFDRANVTLVAPLVGTHALWSVAISLRVLGRSEAIGRRLAVASLFIVAGAALISVVRGEDGTVTVDEAAAVLAERSDTPGASSAGPPRGVYLYSTSGKEEIDALISPSHTYPGDTVMSVEGTPCGWLERWAPLEGRTTERELCADDAGLRLNRYREIHTFLANVDERDYVCDETALLLPAELAPDASTTFTCDAGHTAETWTGGLIGRESHVLTEPGLAIHLRFDTVLSGRTTGTSTKELWLRESDMLVVEERVTNASATDTAIGDVNYLERYTLELAATAPAG